ncbi:MAG: response regulator, partial [Desulfofustis sp.]|nr:response regulator [Desulfofustis sp.]
MKQQPIKVMVVEDEVLIGLMLVRKLQARGYQVDEVVTSGEEAVCRAGRERFDVILMDVTLAGELSGIEAAQQIKERYDTPIIVYSGYDDKQF